MGPENLPFAEYFFAFPEFQNLLIATTTIMMMTMKNPPWYAPFVSACTIGILCISLFNTYCRENNEDGNDDGDDEIDDNDDASTTVKHRHMQNVTSHHSFSLL